MLKVDPGIPICYMAGLGCDSFYELKNLLENDDSRNISREEFVARTVGITSMTLLETSYCGYQNEMFVMPLMARYGFRYQQIVKAGPKVSDRYIVLSDTRHPRKLWLYGWATPPLSPMSEGIPYDVEGLHNPLHPLYNPDAVWDLKYRPENFIGLPDPYLEWEFSNPDLVFRIDRQPCDEYRNHRHYVCRLDDEPIDDDGEAIGCKDGYGWIVQEQCKYFFAQFPQAKGYGLGDYCQRGATLPQLAASQRACTHASKIRPGKQAQVDVVNRSNPTEGYSLLHILQDGAALPQRAGHRRSCSDVAKQESSLQRVEDHAQEEAEGYGLRHDLVDNGVIPQMAVGKGKGKCSIKHKNRPCNQSANDVAISQDWQEDRANPVPSRLLLSSADHAIVLTPSPNAGLSVLSHNGERLEFEQLQVLINSLPQHRHLEKVPGVLRQVGMVYSSADINMAVPLPPFCYVVINYNGGEGHRVLRAEFSLEEQQQAKKTPVRPEVYRMNIHPLHDEGTTRSQLEQSLWHYCLEWFWRSACTACPFPNICGDGSEIMPKYLRLPHETGLAILIEENARIPNFKQTIFAGKPPLLQMMQEIGNEAAVQNFLQRIDALPWAIYRYQRITGMQVYRWNKVLLTGTRQEISDRFGELCETYGATIKIDEYGTARGWIEHREWQETVMEKGKPVLLKSGKPKVANCSVQDLLVVAPKLPVEKHKKGFSKAWAAAHTEQLELELAIAAVTNKRKLKPKFRSKPKLVKERRK